MGCVYIIEGGGYFKIGKTEAEAVDRMRNLQTAAPFPLTLIHQIPARNPRNLEMAFHARFADKRIHRLAEKLLRTRADSRSNRVMARSVA